VWGVLNERRPDNGGLAQAWAALDEAEGDGAKSAKPLLPPHRQPGKLVLMKHVPKETTDDALIQEFLNKGGKVSVGKTKPANPELGLSKNVWNNKLTKEEKAARDKK